MFITKQELFFYQWKSNKDYIILMEQSARFSFYEAKKIGCFLETFIVKSPLMWGRWQR